MLRQQTLSLYFIENLIILRALNIDRRMTQLINILESFNQLKQSRSRLCAAVKLIKNKFPLITVKVIMELPKKRFREVITVSSLTL